MTSIAFDEDTNDVKFVNGDFVLIDGAEEVEHLLRSRLRTFLSEWFLDSRIGVPWHEEVLVKNPNIARVDATLKEIIIETSGVLELLKFELSFDQGKRTLDVDFSVRSQEGIIDIKGVF